MVNFCLIWLHWVSRVWKKNRKRHVGENRGLKFGKQTNEENKNVNKRRKSYFTWCVCDTRVLDPAGVKSPGHKKLNWLQIKTCLLSNVLRKMPTLAPRIRTHLTCKNVKKLASQAGLSQLDLEHYVQNSILWSWPLQLHLKIINWTTSCSVTRLDYFWNVSVRTNTKVDQIYSKFWPILKSKLFGHQKIDVTTFDAFLLKTGQLFILPFKILYS